MKKRIFCLLTACILLSLNMVTVFAAANEEFFPHAIAYSNVKDIGLEKRVRAVEVIEYETGRIIVDTNINEVYNPVGKDVILMTVFTALYSIRSDSITIPEGAIVDAKTNSLGIKPGMNVAVVDVAAAALLNNDVNAANALAMAVDSAPGVFVARMNRLAQEMGMSHSHYTNVTGRPDKNQVTTVSDMTLLAVYCYRNKTITDITSTESHFIKTDEVINNIKILENPFQLVNSASEFFNRSIFGVGISDNGNGTATSLVTFITSKQKYIIVMRSAEKTAYNDIVAVLDYVKKNYALIDISKNIFELCEKTFIEIGGEKVYFTPMKNTVSNVNVVANLFYSRSVSTLSDEYSIKPPETLPDSVKVGDVIKNFRIYYNGKQISSISLSVKSIGELKEEETTLGFTIYHASDIKTEKGNFLQEHSWIILVGIVLIIGVALIIGVNNLRNI